MESNLISIVPIHLFHSALVSWQTDHAATLQMVRVIRLTMSKRAGNVVKSILIKRGGGS